MFLILIIVDLSLEAHSLFQNMFKAKSPSGVLFVNFKQVFGYRDQAVDNTCSESTSYTSEP